MEMIIGGAFQGKGAYAKEHFRELAWVSAGNLDEEGLLAAEGILDFQEYIKKALKEGQDVSGLGERLAQGNPHVVLTCQEVGYGVVPVDAFDRKYREAVGRICTRLAAYSSRVTRVVCGIGTVIKDA